MFALCGSSHRGRGGHVAEKVKVVDVLPVWPKREKRGEKERAVIHHNNESCTIMKAPPTPLQNLTPDRVWRLHGWVGVGS